MLMKFTIYTLCMYSYTHTCKHREKGGIQNVPQLNRITGLLKTTHIKK